MKALVTGGAGFIGAHLVRALLTAGHEVVVLDDLSKGKKERLLGVEGALTFVEGSIEDLPLLKPLFEGVDCIFHHAAFISVPESIQNPYDYYRVNIRGFLTVLEAARHAQVKRLVYASSAAVYGEAEGEKIQKESLSSQPLSPYALSKCLNESYAGLYSRLYGLETVGLRYFNVFGPDLAVGSVGTGYASVMSAFKKAAALGEELAIFGDGMQTRDFVYVEDVVQANLLAAQAPKEKVSGQVLNVGSGQTTTVLHLLELFEKTLGHSLPCRYYPMRQGDILHSSPDLSRAQSLMGFRARVSLEEGVRSFLLK